MGIDLRNVDVKTKVQFEELIERINADIKFANLNVAEEKRQTPLNVNYLLRRYDEIAYKERRRIFKEKNKCQDCLYYVKPRRCFAIEICPLDIGKEPETYSINKVPVCSRDKEGNCPYGNEVGTCFGFCMRDIISEHRERKRQK